MQPAVMLLGLVLSASVWAGRFNACGFRSEFAEVYAEGRANILASLQRNGRSPTGVFRRIESGANWQRASMEHMTQQLFHGEEVGFKVQTNGKIYIYPKNVQVGAETPMMVFDPSGDYFRITVGRVKANGGIDDKRRYLLRNGDYVPLPLPQGWTQERWLRETHFLADP